MVTIQRRIVEGPIRIIVKPCSAAAAGRKFADNAMLTENEIA